MRLHRVIQLHKQCTRGGTLKVITPESLWNMLRRSYQFHCPSLRWATHYATTAAPAQLGINIGSLPVKLRVVFHLGCPELAHLVGTNATCPALLRVNLNDETALGGIFTEASAAAPVTIAN